MSSNCKITTLLTPNTLSNRWLKYVRCVLMHPANVSDDYNYCMQFSHIMRKNVTYNQVLSQHSLISDVSMCDAVVILSSALSTSFRLRFFPFINQLKKKMACSILSMKLLFDFKNDVPLSPFFNCVGMVFQST